MGRFDTKKSQKNLLEDQVMKMVNETVTDGSSSEEEESRIEMLRKKIKLLEKRKKKEEPCCSSSKKQSTDEDEPLSSIKKRKGEKQDRIISQQSGKQSRESKATQPSEKLPEALESPQRMEPEKSPTLQSASKQTDKFAGLYGKHYEGDTMVDIGKNIFARETIYNMAMVSSCKPTHVARKLVEGVFPLETIISSTLTGISPRAQGKERQLVPVKALDLVARTAIIECAIKTGADRNWIIQDVKTIEKAISQRIGEIKRLEQQRNSRKDV